MCRKLRMRWFFDVSKVKESSFLNWTSLKIGPNQKYVGLKILFSIENRDLRTTIIYLIVFFIWNWHENIKVKFKISGSFFIDLSQKSVFSGWGSADVTSLLSFISKSHIKFSKYNNMKLSLRRPLRRKFRMRWFFDISKVKESSFFKTVLTDPPQIFDAHLLENTDLSSSRFHFSVGFISRSCFESDCFIAYPNEWDWREKERCLFTLTNF